MIYQDEEDLNRRLKYYGIVPLLISNTTQMTATSSAGGEYSILRRIDRKTTWRTSLWDVFSNDPEQVISSISTTLTIFSLSMELEQL